MVLISLRLAVNSCSILVMAQLSVAALFASGCLATLATYNYHQDNLNYFNGLYCYINKFTIVIYSNKEVLVIPIILFAFNQEL